MAKPDPSFKSKRYRDKLRQEIRSLEHMLPVSRSALHRRLDSQTVFRLAIAYFRTKLFLQDTMMDSEDRNHVVSSYTGQESRSLDRFDPTDQIRDFDIDEFIETDSLLQAMDGFVMALTSDGTMMYVSNNILLHLGFNQVDVMMRCIYGIVHPDDHNELKSILEGRTLVSQMGYQCSPDNQTAQAMEEYSREGARVSFLCRMKCFSGSTTGYVKMHCVGHLRSFPSIAPSQRTTNDVLFAFCRPFVSMATESNDARKSGFWTKHDLDLKFKQMDKNIEEMLGYNEKELEKMTMYQLLHPEDLHTLSSCHKTLMTREDIQTLYIRVQHADTTWQWLHTRGKLVFKNAKKYSIVFTHCPVREEDSTYIQQEVILRQKYAIHNLINGVSEPRSPCYEPTSGFNEPTSGFRDSSAYGGATYDGFDYCEDDHPACPSSWHTSPDRHSPVFPHNFMAANNQITTKRQRVTGGSTGLKAAFDRAEKEQRWQAHEGNTWPNNSLGEQVHYTHGNSSYNWQNTALPSDTLGPAVRVYRPIAQKLKRYHLRFDGIGIPTNPVAPSLQNPQTIMNTNINPFNQSECSAMFIQGHVTAIEAGGGYTGSHGYAMYPYDVTNNMHNSHYMQQNYSNQYPWYSSDHNKYPTTSTCDKYPNEYPTTYNGTKTDTMKQTKHKNPCMLAQSSQPQKHNLVSDFDVPGYVKKEHEQNPYLDTFDVTQPRRRYASCRFATSHDDVNVVSDVVTRGEKNMEHVGEKQHVVSTEKADIG